MKCLLEQGVVKSSDEFENDCIAVYCGVRVVVDSTSLTF